MRRPHALTGRWPDPTSYSADAVGICHGLPLEAERVALGIPWLRSFDTDAGHVVERLVVGANLEVSTLWGCLRNNPATYARLPTSASRCQPSCPEEFIRMPPEFLSGMPLSFNGHRHNFC